MKSTVFIIVMTFCISQAIFSQDLTSASNTFAKFNVTMLGIIDKLDPYETKTKKEENLLKENKVKLDQMMHDEMYAYLMEGLAEKQIKTEEIGALKDIGVIYLKQGYPSPFGAKGAIKKANKKGYKSDYYLDVSISMGTAIDLLAGKTTKQVRPESSVKITVMDNEGNKLKSISETYKAEKRLKSTDVVSRDGFNKLESSDYSLLLEALRDNVTQCIDQALTQL